MSQYNGWANYATWRVNLEIFDGMTLEDLLGREYVDLKESDTYDLHRECTLALKDYVEGLIYESGGGDGNIAVDYALAFISEVDWYSIAKHMIDAALEERRLQDA